MILKYLLGYLQHFRLVCVQDQSREEPDNLEERIDIDGYIDNARQFPIVVKRLLKSTHIRSLYAPHPVHCHP